MKCPKCLKEIKDNNDNFCKECGAKLRETCNCWMKNKPYNCGRSICPGYSLPLVVKHS